MPSKIFGTVLSHGLRGRMLTKSELQTLAEARDMEELVTRMKNTVYLDAFAYAFGAHVTSLSKVVVRLR